MRASLRRRPSPALIIACLALFLSLAGVGVASNGTFVARSSVGSAYSVYKDEIGPEAITGLPITLTLPNLPAGSYAISAKIILDDRLGLHVTYTCTLAAGGDSDQAMVEMPALATLPLQIVHTFPSNGGQAVLTCSGGDSYSFAKRAKITAIRVATLSNVAG
jgi:hypothetical protein